MKIGIKKINEDDWQIHIDNAFVHLDRFSLELLYCSVEDLLALNEGQQSTALTAHIKLAEKILMLSDADMSLLLINLDNEDILKLILVAKDLNIEYKVLQNIGGIMSKQLLSDIELSDYPATEDAITAIKNIVEKMFELEMSGQIEFIESDAKFI